MTQRIQDFDFDKNNGEYITITLDLNELRFIEITRTANIVGYHAGELNFPLTELNRQSIVRLNELWKKFRR